MNYIGLNLANLLCTFVHKIYCFIIDGERNKAKTIFLMKIQFSADKIIQNCVCSYHLFKCMKNRCNRYSDIYSLGKVQTGVKRPTTKRLAILA